MLFSQPFIGFGHLLIFFFGKMENNRQKQLLTTVSCCFQPNFYVKYEIINNTPSQVSPVRVMAPHSAQSRHVEADSVHHTSDVSRFPSAHKHKHKQRYVWAYIVCMLTRCGQWNRLYYATYKLSQANQANPIPSQPKHSTKRWIWWNNRNAERNIKRKNGKNIHCVEQFWTETE